MDVAVGLEWDEVKAAANLAKHGVPFSLAARVFEDPRVLISDVSRALDREVRHKAIGRVDGRMFTVVHTRRAHLIRVISVRRSNRPEERSYDRPLHL